MEKSVRAVTGPGKMSRHRTPCCALWEACLMRRHSPVLSWVRWERPPLFSERQSCLCGTPGPMRETGHTLDRDSEWGPTRVSQMQMLQGWSEAKETQSNVSLIQVSFPEEVGFYQGERDGSSQQK